jgi:PEGA domain-containing protein
MLKFITMTKKIITLTILFSILLSAVCSAAVTGKLNVFTDQKDAVIYIDSKQVGNENLVGFNVDAGEHYLKVLYHGKTSYAKVITIYPDQTKTVVVENFQDFKTNAPSRGALDREAARLRETRGNMAFGAYGGSPSSGLSFKWWFSEKLGLQVAGFTQTLGAGEVDDNIGGRLLINLADKVYGQDTITSYLAVGFGKDAYTNSNSSELNEYTDMSELAFGLELKLGREGSKFIFQSSEGSLSENAINIIGQLLTLGILNTTYVSIEIGTESKYRVWNNRDNVRLNNMKISGGIHYYF